MRVKSVTDARKDFRAHNYVALIIQAGKRFCLHLGAIRKLGRSGLFGMAVPWDLIESHQRARPPPTPASLRLHDFRHALPKFVAKPENFLAVILGLMRHVDWLAVFSVMIETAVPAGGLRGI
jgi:hypothetical protein